jgi:hypothetical protein
MVLLLAFAAEGDLPGSSLLERLSDAGRWLPTVAELAVWFFVAPVLLVALAGVGLWVLRAGDSDLELPHAVAAGGLTIVAAVSIANLYVPIPPTTGLWLIPVGVTGFLLGRRSRGIEWSATISFLAVGAAAVALLMVPLRPRLQYDVFLYHGPVLEWMSRAPLPQGLGLFHSRFAFNPGLLLLTAAFRTPFGDWSHHALVEAAVIGFSAATLASVLVMARRRGDRRLTAFVAALLLVGGALLALVSFRAGTDLAVSGTVLAAVAVAALVATAQDDGEVIRWYRLLVLLVAFSIIQKASAAPVVILLTAPWVRVRSCSRWGVLLRGSAGPLLLAATAGAAWAHRTYVASACLAYPVPFTCRDVAWGLGPLEASAESGVIRSWARQRTTAVPDLADLTWLSAWTVEYLKSPSFLLVAIAAIAAAVVRFTAGPISPESGVRTSRGDLRVPTMYVVLGLAFWFMMAPDIRFGYHLHVTLGALLITPLVERAVIRWDRWRSTVDRDVVEGRWPVPAALVAGAALFVLAGHLLLFGRMLPYSSTPPGVPLELVERSLTTLGSSEPADWIYFTPEGTDQCGPAFPCAPSAVGVQVDTSGRRLVFVRPLP